MNCQEINQVNHHFLMSRPLKDCKDLDVPMFRLLTESLSRHLEMDLFGFDVLVETGTKNVFICDVNYLPGYKGA